MKVLNPATGEVLTELESDNVASVRQKYEILKKGQLDWGQKSVSDRVATISTFCDLLKTNIEPLALELCHEVGKPINEARGEINGAIHKMKFFLEQSQEVLSSRKIHEDGNTQELLGYEPLGVIANISAWNYPYLVGVNIFIPALISGNAVLYKPSEYSSLVGKSIERLLHQAGVPPNVFQAVCGDGSVGKLLCELPLDGYFFTGSYKTGQAIAMAVAHKLVPVGLELGGKDPLYITDEIPDIDTAASNAVEGAFYNNGQSCCAVERIYVHQNIYDKFINSFVDHVKKLKVGDPILESTQQGAITQKKHLIFLENQVRDAKQKGAVLECGGEAITSGGQFFSPTVFSQVNHDMLVMTEETFGPVIGVMKVSSDEEAIALMNDTIYGLTSAVFTSNKTRGESILNKINSGTGYLNCCDRVSGYLPWSGRGHSGLGSTLSAHGLYAFCHPKAFHIRL